MFQQQIRLIHQTNDDFLLSDRGRRSGAAEPRQRFAARKAPNDLRVVTNVDHNVHTILYPKRIAIVHHSPSLSYELCGVTAPLTSNKTALAMICKLAEAAEKSWRRLDAHNQLPKVILGVRFADGIEIKSPQVAAA